MDQGRDIDSLVESHYERMHDKFNANKCADCDDEIPETDTYCNSCMVDHEEPIYDDDETS